MVKTDPTLVAVAREERVHGDPFAAFRLADVAAMRLLLRGDSVIDWHKLAFSEASEVDRFLRVQEFDPADERDARHLERLRQEALDYLEQTLNFTVPAEVDAAAVPELLLLASAPSRARPQVYACILLKVMHVLHHLYGRELLTKLPVSTDELFHMVEAKVLRVREELSAIGSPAVVEFAWSRKRREAQITKLLAKRETLAAEVYDKLRFRLVTAHREDIPLVLRYLTRRVVPFNYAVPGQSENSLWPVRRMVEETSLRRFLPEIAWDGDETGQAGRNEFSGPTYRVINFVADLPVRMDKFLCRQDDLYEQFGPVAFVLSEFQVMDAQTALDNERGENSHDEYKGRQITRVKARLMRRPNDGAGGAA